ncbi:MAG: NepR family anti-sigma factor [Cypionkella sp.]
MRWVPRHDKYFSGTVNLSMPQKPTIPQTISSSVAKQIDENLRLIYAETLKEQIPDHLQQLLKQLRDKDTAP